jgi:hypothetical protein
MTRQIRFCEMRDRLRQQHGLRSRLRPLSVLLGVALSLAATASPNCAAGESLPPKAAAVLQNIFFRPVWEVRFPTFVHWLLPRTAFGDKFDLSERGLVDEDKVLFREFLLAHGYLQVGGGRKYSAEEAPCLGGCPPGVVRRLLVTDRLRPIILKSADSDWFPDVTLAVVRNSLKSIDKVEQRKEGDNDIWRFVLSYQVTSAFPEVPVASTPIKATGFVAFNRFTEQWRADVTPLSDVQRKPMEVWEATLKSMRDSRSRWASRIPPYGPEAPAASSTPAPPPTPSPGTAQVGSAAADRRPLVLTVDGVSLPAIVHWTASRTAYLQPVLKTLTADFGAIVTWRAWSGDPVRDTKPTVADLKIQISQLVKDKKGRPLVIATHSWGGVLAYVALKDLESDKQNPLPRGAVDLLITIHTPLGMSAPNPALAVMYLTALGEVKGWVTSLIKRSEPAPLPSVRRWENYFSKEDDLSGEIAARGLLLASELTARV